jgi:hypothetical protein
MTLPTSIRKRDGRLLPFEPEKISRSLFAVTEELGAPDAFLARELTDGALHFLNQESDGGPIAAADLAEMVAKVVRELGYPAIARVYEEHDREAASVASLAAVERRPEWAPPRADALAVLHGAAAAQLRSYSLAQAYPRDLAFAHRDGLLRLLDLDHPGEMAGVVWPLSGPLPTDGWEMLEAFMAARAVAGGFIAIDGPDYALARLDGEVSERVAHFLQAIERCVELTGLRVILNLNIAEPPPWAQRRDLGPLFQDVRPDFDRDEVDRVADQLLRRAERHSVVWHLSERDYEDAKSERLRGTIAAAAARAPIEFAFDRPRRPVQLGPGIDRDNPAVLGCVGLNLPHFVEQLGGGHVGREAFAKKLPSLVRFAKSAGHVRQDYLRRHGRADLQQGFLLERAVQIVAPLGLIAASRSLVGEAARWNDVIDFACGALETIRKTLAADRSRTISTRIDWPCRLVNIDDLLFIGNNGLSPQQEIRLGAELLCAAGSGSLTLRLNPNDSGSVEQFEGLLRLAWKHELSRLQWFS